MKFILFLKKFWQNDQDKKMMCLIKRSYKSTRIIGRGTLVISPSEVANSESFKQLRKRAKILVDKKANVSQKADYCP